MLLQSKEGINVLQVWSLNDLIEKISTSLDIRYMYTTLFFFFFFLIGCLQVFPTFVYLDYCQDVFALFVQVIIKMMCLHCLFRLLLGCVCKAMKELCEVMLLFIIVLHVLSSCELTMDNDEWEIIMGIIILIEVFKHV